MLSEICMGRCNAQPERQQYWQRRARFILATSQRSDSRSQLQSTSTAVQPFQIDEVVYSVDLGGRSSSLNVDPLAALANHLAALQKKESLELDSRFTYNDSGANLGALAEGDKAPPAESRMCSTCTSTNAVSAAALSSIGMYAAQVESPAKSATPCTT